MKNKLFKLSAFVLALSTMICSIPLTLAAAGDLLESEEVDPLPAEDESSADENVPFIVGEDDELRAESVKHFRLSDGSYLMVDYGTPVHYESDGDWLDIDNTLVSRDGRYENAQGESKVSFSADEYSDELYTLESGGHRLTLGAASQDALPASRPSEPAAELPTAVMSEAADTVSDGAASDVSEADVAADDSVSDAANLQTGEAIDENAAVGCTESTAEPSAVSDSYDDSETPAVPDSSDGDAVTAEPAQRGTKREIVLGGFDSERSAESDETQTAEYSAALSEARSTALTVSEYIDENPYATEEELSEVREEQNGKNMRQRAEIIGSVRNQDRIGYRGVFDGAALEYTLGGGMVKEDIIIAERADSYIYSFEFDTALTLERDGAGLVLRDGEQTVFVLPAPYMTDAAGSRSDAVSYSFELREGGYTLTVTADGRWIDSDERVFPVTVDPTVSTSSDYSAGQVTTDYICDNDTVTSHIGENKWMIGRSPKVGTYYSYIKFNSIPDIPYNSRIIAAHMLLAAYSKGNSGATISDFNIVVQKALLNWREQITAAKSNSNPLLDYYNFQNSDVGKWISFDITGAIDNLGSDGTGFYLYSLKSNGDQMTNSSYYELVCAGAAEKSSNPVLALQYRNIMGIESYYTNSSSSAGRAGKIYIGDYSGNLVIKRSLASEVGINISYVYNSRYADWVLNSNAEVFHTVDYSNMRSAAGWRLNIQQSVVSKIINVDGESKEYLIYSDGDGTEHWLTPDGSNRWKDEDGLNLTATRSNDTVTICDDSDNKKVFLYGYLWYMEGSDGDKAILLYGAKAYGTASYPKQSGSLLSRVIYRPKSGADITVADFEYTNSVLTAVVDRSGSRVTLSQSTSDMLLTKITDPDGKGAIYRYREFPYRISAAYDTETSIGCGFTYYLTNDDYLTSYTSFYSDNIYDDSVRTNLSEIEITRSSGSVTYTDKGHRFSYNDDDIVSTVSFDTLGRTVSTYSTDADDMLINSAGAGYTVNIDTSAKNNKLIREGSAGAIGQNLLSNGGFEKTSKWLNISHATYSTDTAYTGTRSMKLVSNSSGIGMMYNELTLSAGTYTLSARVKVTEIGNETGKVGARIYIGDSSSTPCSESVYLNKVTSESVDDGWVLLHCTYKVPSTQKMRMVIALRGNTGIAYFDNVMLQKGETVSSFNLLDNSSFSNGTTSWLKSGTTSSEINVISGKGIYGTDDNILSVPSAPYKTAGIYQTVNLSIPGTETLMLSAFAKASSAPLDDDEDAVFELGAILTYSDGTTDTFKQQFN